MGGGYEAGRGRGRAKGRGRGASANGVVGVGAGGLDENGAGCGEIGACLDGVMEREIRADVRAGEKIVEVEKVAAGFARDGGEVLVVAEDCQEEGAVGESEGMGGCVGERVKRAGRGGHAGNIQGGRACASGKARSVTEGRAGLTLSGRFRAGV